MLHKLLIVDDDPMNVSILEELFSDDYQVHSVNTGEKALEVLPEYRPDLVLLDIMMPGLNGYEVCTKIREDKRFSTLKVILVSAKAMLDERLKGYEVGADDYITKPFDDHEIKAKIRVFMDLKKSEELSKLKSNFITLISHETNTPLNGIFGFSQILQESPNLDDEEKEYVQSIITSTKTLSSLIEKATLFSKLRSGDIQLRLKKCQPQKILSKVVNDLEEKISEKHINIQIEDTTEDPLIDKSYFEKVAGFIIDNSINASKDAGKILVKTTQNDQIFTLTVTDEGTGITLDNINDVFQEMHGDNIMHHSTGHNLSLPLVKEIAILHGGKAYVKNNDESGATVTVELSTQL